MGAPPTSLSSYHGLMHMRISLLYKLTGSPGGGLWRHCLMCVGIV